MADGPGYNPYRKENGEFASKGEVGDLNEKIASDLVDAQDAGDEKLATQIEDYAMEKLPESPIGRKLLEERYGAAATTSKSGADYSKLGGRELQKLAKDTEEKDLQLEIARRGSEAARRNLARNQFATKEALESAYIVSEDDATRQEIANHPSSDLRIMHPTHVAGAVKQAADQGVGARGVGARGATGSLSEIYKERAEATVAANWIDDATFNELRRISGEDVNPRVGSSVEPLIRRAMKNPDNLISEDTALDYAKSSPLAGSIAIEHNRISPERLKELPPESARFEWSSNQKVLAEAARLSTSGHWDRPEKDAYGKEDPHGRKSRDIVRGIAITNTDASPEILDRFVGDPRADQLELYRSPRLGEDSRKRLEESDPTVKSYLRVERAAERVGGKFKLRNDLVLSGDETSSRRGYHQADMQLDRAKIESYGLEPADVERIFGGDFAQPGYRYDPSTGRYSGSHDSGD